MGLTVLQVERPHRAGHSLLSAPSVTGGGHPTAAVDGGWRPGGARVPRVAAGRGEDHRVGAHQVCARASSHS